jgi:guanylate kinase
MPSPPAPRGPGNGSLIVLSAPSGTGKTTLARELVARVPGLRPSISYTTRPRREAERDGVDYHFVDRGRFQELVAQGEFLEWAEIYDELYGTGRTASEQILARGEDLLLVIDVQGARWVRKRAPEALLVFLLPPEYQALLHRLRRRGTESTGTEAKRLQTAGEEVLAWKEYDYIVINDDLDSTRTAVEAIIRARRQARDRMTAEAERIVATFPREAATEGKSKSN